MRLKRLKHKILVSFFSITLLSVFFIILGFEYIKQKEKVENISSSVRHIYNFVLKDFKVVSDFLNSDTRNLNFFKDGKSEYILQHKTISDSIQVLLKQVREQSKKQKFGIDNELLSITNHLSIYQYQFDTLVVLIQKRGFKDFGIEGQMRTYIHALEALKNIDQVKMLTLRRHEKDFIIRNEDQYIEKLHKVAQDFEQEIKQNKQDSALFFLSNYVKKFDELVACEKEMGLRRNTGLKPDFDKQSNSLQKEFESLIYKTESQTQSIYTKINYLYFLLVAFLIALTIGISFFLSHIITRRLSILSTHIRSFVESGFTQASSLDFDEKEDEVGYLMSDVVIMQNQFVELINNFKEKVEEKTAEIRKRKVALEQQKEEISAQRDQLFETNELIKEQKKIVELQNKSMLDSIQYAKYIQEALLPHSHKFEDYFSDHFVVYIPKDIISGDFYWLRRVHNANVDITLLAVADCTGHGVPGALMSMLGIAFLNEIVIRKQILEPHKILETLRTNVISVFQQENQSNYNSDGMDVALCAIDNTSQKMFFSGANRPIYWVRNGNIHKVEGSKMPVGKYLFADKEFQTVELQMQKNDLIYLYSDGYTDQFGGERNQKFKSKSFVKMIDEHQNKPLSEQKDIFINEHIQWKGNNKQTDDILVIGLKI